MISDDINGIKMKKEPVRYLGIYIGHNKQLCHNLNWEAKIDKMQKNT